MAMKGVAVAIAVIVVLILAFLSISAQGAPSTPTATLSGTLNPAVSQNYQVTFKTQFYSLVAPNTIYQIGGKFYYSAWQTNAKGTETSITQNASVPFSTASVTGGDLYTVTGTVTLSLTSICTGAGCPGTNTFNLTIDVSAAVATYLAYWQTPTTNIVFSTNPNYQTTQNAPSPSANTYYLELWIPVTGIVATLLLLWVFLKPMVWVGAVAILALLALPLEYLFWAIL